MIQRISIPKWHEMALAGQAPPMRILIQGHSMYPLIRKGRDYVTIQPLTETPRQGDIVLFYYPEHDSYVLHRAWKVENGQVLTWGDNCRRPDGWFDQGLVWGRVSLVERGFLRIRPGVRRGMLLARIWHVLGKDYRAAQSKKRRMIAAIKKLEAHGATKER